MNCVVVNFPKSVGKGSKKKIRKNCALLTNPPRTPPGLPLFPRKKIWPIIIFGKMNNWCVKQILHLVPSKISIFASVISVSFAQNRPKSDISGALGPIHYITLKAFAMALGDGTKCKTCFGCPRMVLCGPWKTFFSSFKNRVWFGVTLPPVWQNTRLFTCFF